MLPMALLPVALLDACVLYPAPLRDLLMWLAHADVFLPRWTDRIHDEWTRGILRTRPELAGSLRRTRALMDKSVPDCLVSGYEHLIPLISLPDPDDRHVLAAAVTGGVDVIVTSNLRHFPRGALTPEPVHPDVFIRHLLDSGAAALGAVRLHRASLVKPPKTVDEYLQTLARQGLPETVAALRRWADVI